MTRSTFAWPFLLWMAVQPDPCCAEHLRIWVKSFIPNTGLDIVKPVPGHSGQSMIPGPHVLGIPVDSTCYNTNNRTFSADAGADAKFSVVIDLDLFTPGMANFTAHQPEVGETIRFDCATGQTLATGTASADEISVGQPSFTSGVVSFAIDAEATNPLVHAPEALIPSIKLHGNFTLDGNSRTVAFSGSISEFPAFEAYVQVDQGSPVALFQVSPADDATPWSLLSTRQVTFRVSY